MIDYKCLCEDLAFGGVFSFCQLSSGLVTTIEIMLKYKIQRPGNGSVIHFVALGGIRYETDIITILAAGNQWYSKLQRVTLQFYLK